MPILRGSATAGLIRQPRAGIAMAMIMVMAIRVRETG